MKETRTCSICGNKFRTPVTSRRRTDSSECARKWRDQQGAKYSAMLRDRRRVERDK